MPPLPSWLQPQDVVGAYLGGAARGDASRRTALAERSQASEEMQAQQAIGLQRERIGAANRAQELELEGIALRSQAQQAAAQEKQDFARALREQKAAESAVRFQGASEFARLVADGMSTDKALLKAGQKMFYNKPDALVGALQKEEQQSAMKLFRDEEQRRKLDDQIARLNQASERSQFSADKLMLEGRLRGVQEEANRLRAAGETRMTQAAEIKAKNDYVKQLAQDAVEAPDALYNWNLKQAGKEELSVAELNDRRKSRNALTQLETLKRTGQDRVSVVIDANDGITVGKPGMFSKGELIDEAIKRYRGHLGKEAESVPDAKPKRVRVKDKKSGKTGYWEGGDAVPDIYEIIEE